MTLHVNDGGVWKSSTPYVKDGGVWKAVQQLYVRDAGTWKLVFQSGPTFNPVPGTYLDEGTPTASVTVSASEAVTWTYTKGPAIVASHASGTFRTNITFTLTASLIDKDQTVNLTATLNGITYNWTLELLAHGSGEGGGG